jgi:hypothetical protein
MSSVAAIGGGAPQVWSGASMRTPPTQKMSNLFDRIDTGNSGSITKAQFEQAFQTMNPPKGFQKMGADALWAKLDPSNSGSVSKDNFTSTMTDVMAQIRQNHGQHHHANANVQTPAQTVSSSLNQLNALPGSRIDTTA